MVEFQSNLIYSISRYGTERSMRDRITFAEPNSVVDKFADKHWSEHPLKLGLRDLLHQCLLELQFIPREHWNKLIVYFYEEKTHSV